jgi:hypothetical protein
MRHILILCLVLLSATAASAQRTDLVAAKVSLGYPTAGLAGSFAACDVSNKNAVILSGDNNDILVLYNSDASTHNVTINSISDTAGRKGDITETITAGQLKIYGSFKLDGWKQVDGRLYFNADNALVKAQHIQLR